MIDHINQDFSWKNWVGGGGGGGGSTVCLAQLHDGMDSGSPLHFLKGWLSSSWEIRGVSIEPH